MNIAVMGHQGMLGKLVLNEVMLRGHVLRIFHEESWEPQAKRLETISPDSVKGVEAVINCAGIVPQRQEAASQIISTNSYAPHRLAEICEMEGARLIHVSTDCVFTAPGPHTEASPISPSSLYGISKAAGEVTRDHHLTLRTSFIGNGTYGLLSDLQEQPKVKASKRLLWSGHTAQTIAEYLVVLAERYDITGLLHMPGDWTNRLELCQALVKHFDLPTEIEEDNNFFADRRLTSTRWFKLGLPTIPSFLAQLAELKL